MSSTAAAANIHADLHCHSCHSDGVLTPRAVVERAAAQGVAMLALTDHDQTGGLLEAAAAADIHGVHLIPGVEVSVSWGRTTVHIVGLGIDLTDPVLQRGLEQVRSGRMNRARRMAAGLAAVGIDDTLDGALAHASNPALISRTHFARHLVERGVSPNMRDVFSRYLVEGKPGYVPHEWASLADAVAWIRGAGGVAIVAHPARYRLGDLGMHALLSAFKEAGGVAIEVTTSNHTADDVQHYARLVLEFGFEASRGSDFHGPGESANVELGRVAPLPRELTPVWQRFLA